MLQRRQNLRRTQCSTCCFHCSSDINTSEIWIMAPIYYLKRRLKEAQLPSPPFENGCTLRTTHLTYSTQALQMYIAFASSLCHICLFLLCTTICFLNQYGVQHSPFPATCISTKSLQSLRSVFHKHYRSTQRQNINYTILNRCRTLAINVKWLMFTKFHSTHNIPTYLRDGLTASH